MSYSRNKRRKITKEVNQIKQLQDVIANAIIKTLEDMHDKESKTE